MGRPREFDANKALDRALEVFWRKGYDGASISDLTAAMRINPPSLYAAFGNKEQLFRKALDRYADRHGNFWNEALEAPTARGMVEYLLHQSADFLTKASNPRGCLFVRSSLMCSESGAAVARELRSRRAAGETAVCARLERAKGAGEMPPELNPRDFTRYIMTVLDGMSVRAAAGATRDELHKIAATALRAWPA